MDLHEGPKSKYRIKGPHSARGFSKFHEGPHRNNGHVMHKIQFESMTSSSKMKARKEINPNNKK